MTENCCCGCNDTVERIGSCKYLSSESVATLYCPHRVGGSVWRGSGNEEKQGKDGGRPWRKLDVAEVDD